MLGPSQVQPRPRQLVHDQGTIQIQLNRYSCLGGERTGYTLRDGAIYDRVKTLGDAMLDSDHRRVAWYDWLYHSPFHNLEQANTHLTTLGLDTPTVSARIGRELDPNNKDTIRIVRKNLQRHIYKGQMEMEAHLKIHAVRRRTIRWTNLINSRRPNGPILPPLAAENFLNNLAVIHKMAKPRVAAAVWETLWNGWCTSRRFQKQGRCVFGCASLHACDSLEHYFFCPILVHFATQWLGINDSEMHCPSYFLMLDKFENEDKLLAMAHLVYSAYSAYHNLRLSPLPLPPLPLPPPPPLLLHTSDVMFSKPPFTIAAPRCHWAESRELAPRSSRPRDIGGTATFNSYSAFLFAGVNCSAVVGMHSCCRLPCEVFWNKSQHFYLYK